MTQDQPAPATGARIIIRTCLHLTKGDIFLLIYDETTNDFLPVFREAAVASDLRFTSAFVPMAQQAEGDAAFSSELLTQLQLAHGILVATTDDSACSKFRITLTTDKRGAKSTVATMPGGSLDTLVTAIDIDYEEAAKMCLKLTLPLIRGQHCLLTSYDSHGKRYQLTFELARNLRPPIQSYGIIPRLAWGNVPAGETFVAPLETTANGDFLVNGAVGTEIVTKSREALIRFENGKVIAHSYLETGNPIAHLLRIAETARQNGHDDRWSVIAEFGIGVNKNIRKITGVQVVDEKRYGTAHVAIGHNIGYGGENDCRSVHCDMTTVHPSLTIDGHPILDHGRHILDPSLFAHSFRTYQPSQTYVWKTSYKHVRLIDQAYHLEDRRLFASMTTSTGRFTIFPVGDDETARAAFALVSAFAKRLCVPVEELRATLALSEPDIHKLLSLLYMNGVVMP